MIVKIFSVFNFLGIAVLAVLCCLQWGAEHGLQNTISALDKANTDQAQTLSDQAKTIKQDGDDLSDLRQKLAISESALKDAQDKNTAAAAQLKFLSTDRDQLKANLDKYIAAVAERDTALKQASANVQTLASERDAEVQKYNDVVEKYNALVKQQGGGK